MQLFPELYFKQDIFQKMSWIFQQMTGEDLERFVVGHLKKWAANTDFIPVVWDEAQVFLMFFEKMFHSVKDDKGCPLYTALIRAHMKLVLSIRPFHFPVIAVGTGLSLKMAGEASMFSLAKDTDYGEMTIANAFYSAEEVAGYVGKFAPGVPLRLCTYAIGRCRFAASLAEFIIKHNLSEENSFAVQFYTNVIVKFSRKTLTAMTGKIQKGETKELTRLLDSFAVSLMMGKGASVIHPNESQLRRLFESGVALLQCSFSRKLELFEPGMATSYFAYCGKNQQSIICRNMGESCADPQDLRKVFELLVANNVQKYFETERHGNEVIFFSSFLQRKHANLRIRLRTPFPALPFFIERLRPEHKKDSSLLTLCDFLFGKGATAPFASPGNVGFRLLL
jgi:hypothetical protein